MVTSNRKEGVIKKIRLDTILEFWHLIVQNTRKDVQRQIPLADYIEPWTRFKETSFRCCGCHKNIAVRITENNDSYAERIKTIKTIFSQLLIYGIKSTVKCVCSECSASHEDEIKVELKDYLNNKYVISGSWHGYSQWTYEVELILALINFYEVYSNCRDQGKGELHKSREAKRFDANDAKFGVHNGTINRSIYIDDSSDDKITRILKQLKGF